MTKENLCGIIFRYESTLAALAQLDRVFGYEPKGRGFESLTPCQEKHRGYFLGAFLLYDDTMKNPAILLLQNCNVCDEVRERYLISPPQTRVLNPLRRANKNRTFVYQQMFCFCLSKPQAWYIIDARSAAHIISPFGAVSHHAPACIFLRLDDIQCFALMIYRNKLRMIYTPSV